MGGGLTEPAQRRGNNGEACVRAIGGSIKEIVYLSYHSERETDGRTDVEGKAPPAH